MAATANLVCIVCFWTLPRKRVCLVVGCHGKVQSSYNLGWGSMTAVARLPLWCVCVCAGSEYAWLEVHGMVHCSCNLGWESMTAVARLLYPYI